MRIWFQESATPRQLAPKMSMPLLCPNARISRASWTDLLCQDDDLPQLGIDPNQLGHAVSDARRRQVDDASVERESGVKSFPDAVEDRDAAGLRWQHLALASR
jgi:hypothetical protein